MDDEVACDASKKEIVRRYYDALCRKRNGLASEEEIYKAELIMKRVGIDPDYRKVIAAATAKAEQTGEPATAIELPCGIVTGKTSKLMGASASALLNALKMLGGIDDAHLLLPVEVIEPIQKLKVGHMGAHNPRMHTDELLIALSICAVTDPIAARAMAALDSLRGSEVHSTVILSSADEGVFRKLGMNLSCEPRYQTKRLYHR